MSPPAGAAGREAARRDARRRTSVRRRRSALTLLVVAGTVALLVVLIAPTFQRAVRNFTLPLAYSDIIRQQAAENRLDPALVAAVIYAETKFDPRASRAGAEGLMQILPQTAQFLARRSGATTFRTSDLATPQVNIAYGSYYLRYLLDEYDSNINLALAAYNGGEANVDRWLAQARADRYAFTVADIPFSETQAYVQKVLHVRAEYRATYPAQLGYG